MNRSKRITVILAAVILAGSVAAGCTAPADSQTPPGETSVNGGQMRSVRVETQPVTPTDFTEVIELTGSVEANNDATVSAQTAGTVEYLLPLGATAPRGAIIARINAGLTDAAVEQASAQVASATAQMNLARETYQRQEPLYRDSVISVLEFETVRTQLNQAEAQLQQAEGLLRQVQEQARYTRVTAPFSGRIEQHFVEVGEQTAPGMPIVRIVNTNTVKITTGVPERYAGDISEGSTVEVQFNTYGVDPISGIVSFAGSAIERSSRTFPIEIQVSNRKGQLKPEMIGKVLLTRAQLTDVVVVPLQAIIRDENGTNVFVAENDGPQRVAVRRTVVVGPTYSGRAVIHEGLSPGDELVVSGQNLLTPGDRLDVLSTAPDVSTEASGSTEQDSRTS